MNLPDYRLARPQGFYNVALGSWVSMVYVGKGKFGDSTKSEKKTNGNEKAVDEVTPWSKLSGKRSVDSVDEAGIENEVAQVSSNKPPKLKAVKVEKN